MQNGKPQGRGNEVDNGKNKENKWLFEFLGQTLAGSG